MVDGTDRDEAVECGRRATPETIDARMQARAARSAAPTIVGDVAVIDVTGPISHRESFFSAFFGSATVERMQAQFRAALTDHHVKAIVFRSDSPGGTVSGVPEFAAEIAAARGQKPILAISDTLMASAALWIGSQADQVYVAPSSETGSIGVWTAHEDISGMLEQMGVNITLIFAGTHKVDAHPYGPLADDVRARLQADVDAVHADFIAAVARGRKTSQKSVRDGYGQGLVYNAKDAVKLGLADTIGTFEDVLQRAARKSSTVGARAEIIVAKFDNGTVLICGEHNLEVGDTGCPQCLVETPMNATVTIETETEPVIDPQLVADQDYIDAGIRIAERL